MKVALVQSTPLPPTEGIANHVIQLARHLRSDGHEVHLFTRGGWTSSEETTEGFPTHRPACPPIYPVHAHIHRIPLQRSLSREGPFDVVHLHSPLVPFPKVDAPTVATVHTPIRKDVDSVPQDAPGHRLLRLQVPFSEALENTLIKNADSVTCVSASIKELIQEDLGCSIKVVHNGVDVSEFNPVIEGRDQNSLLYVGRLGRRKGIPRLISVAKQLREREVDFKLNIAGKGPLEDELKTKIEDEKLECYVEYLGFIDRDKLLEYLRKATMLVHLPEFEGLPTTVLEAMASGTPVVATNVPGCRDVVEDGENGILVEPEDSERITEKIVDLLNSPDKRIQYSKSARRTVEKNFDWRQITDDYELVYKEVSR